MDLKSELNREIKGVVFSVGMLFMWSSEADLDLKDPKVLLAKDDGSLIVGAAESEGLDNKQYEALSKETGSNDASNGGSLDVVAVDSDGENSVKDTEIGQNSDSDDVDRSILGQNDDSVIVNIFKLEKLTSKPDKDLLDLIDSNDDFHYRSLYLDLVDSNGENPVRKTEIAYSGGPNDMDYLNATEQGALDIGGSVKDLNNLNATEQELLLTYIECMAGFPAMNLDRETVESKPVRVDEEGDGLCYQRPGYLFPVEGGLDYTSKTLFSDGKFNSLYVFNNLLSEPAKKLLSEDAVEKLGDNVSDTEKASGSFVSLLTHILLSTKRPYDLPSLLTYTYLYKNKDNSGKDRPRMITLDDMRDAISYAYHPYTWRNIWAHLIDYGFYSLIYTTQVKNDEKSSAFITQKTADRLHELRNKIGKDRAVEVMHLGDRFVSDIYLGLIEALVNSKSNKDGGYEKRELIEGLTKALPDFAKKYIIKDERTYVRRLIDFFHNFVKRCIRVNDNGRDNEKEVLFASPDFADKLIKYLDKKGVFSFDFSNNNSSNKWAFMGYKIGSSLTAVYDYMYGGVSSIKDWIVRHCTTLYGSVLGAAQSIRTSIAGWL